MNGHRHVEAYCLMKYQAIDGSEVEWIWNSRDGVTPFCVRSRSGKEMRHVDWRLDRYLPNYRPVAGERIFVDLPPAVAREDAERKVEAYWDDPAYPINTPDMPWRTREEAVEYLAKSALNDGAPYLSLVEATP